MDRNRPALRLRRGPRQLRKWIGSLDWRLGLMLLPLAFLVLFYFYPLAAILQRSFAPEGQLDLGSFGALLGSSYYRDTFLFTLWQALLSTALTLIAALPGAYVFTRYRFPGKALLLSLSTLPFVLPTVVVAAAFTALIGPRGLLNTLLVDAFQLDAPPVQLVRTLEIILIAHVFYNYPLALRMISSYWANQRVNMEEAAQVLGCSGWRLWWEVRLPLLRPVILAAGVLVFIFTFTSFGVVVLLGGPNFATLEVEIFRQARSLFDLPLAAALSLVQVGGMLAMLALYTWLQRRATSRDFASAGHIARRPESIQAQLVIALNIVFMVVLLFLPLLALLAQSLAGEAGTLSLRNYALLSTNPRGSILFVPPLEAVRNSLAFAVITTVLAVLLGLITALLLARRRHATGALVRWLDPLFMLPLATSAVTLGFGYILALDFSPVQDLLNTLLAPLNLALGGDWDLRASPALIPVAHTLVAMPFVVRSVLPALRAIPPSTQEAAQVLGASPWRVWRWIDLPLISRGLLVGATFAFTVSMGEFGASVFITRPEVPTMPTVIFRLLGQPGASNYGQALAMSVILAAVCGISFVLIERLRSAGVGEF